MHTILWVDAKWQKCEMHMLVSSADVKKTYRKACLAVHPDKVRLTIFNFVNFPITFFVIALISANGNGQRNNGKNDLHGTEQRLDGL